MKRTALVFDLDDTLYLEREFVLSGFAAVDEWLRRQLAVTGFAAEAGRRFAAGARGKVFDETLAHLGVEGGAGLVPEMVALYRAHEPRLTLLPDARWALEHYRGRCKLGLLTDGYAATQRHKVAALGIGGCFDEIVYSDDLGRARWKPSPVPFLRMMAGLGCRGTECVYVADNPTKDFSAPNGLGWLTVRIRREGGEHAGVVSGEPAARMITSLRELPDVLG